MSLFGCNCKCSCTLAAVIASAIIGVLAAFLQITGVITVVPVFLWVVFGIAVVYLAVLIVAAVLAGRAETSACLCSALNALLIGIQGAVLLAVVLLAIGIVATSIISAILVGLLVFFFSLVIASSACLVRSSAPCES